MSMPLRSDRRLLIVVSLVVILVGVTVWVRRPAPPASNATESVDGLQPVDGVQRDRAEQLLADLQVDNGGGQAIAGRGMDLTTPLSRVFPLSASLEIDRNYMRLYDECVEAAGYGTSGTPVDTSTDAVARHERQYAQSEARSYYDLQPRSEVPEKGFQAGVDELGGGPSAVPSDIPAEVEDDCSAGVRTLVAKSSEPPKFDRAYVTGELIQSIRANARSLPTVRTAAKAWARCMDNEGLSGATSPWDAEDLPRTVDTAEVWTECLDSSGLLRSWWEGSRDLELAWIDANREAVEESARSSSAWIVALSKLQWPAS